MSERAIPERLAAPAAGPVDRRLMVMRSLVVEDWLVGEWDPQRLLLRAQPGGPLNLLRPCAVADCPNARHAGPLCHGHLGQFRRSGAADAATWAASGEPGPLRRRLSEASCEVSDAAGARCPRPAWGPWDLCIAHATTWSKQRRRGSGLETFLSRARPLPGFGDCTAASCYRVAAHGLGLCDLHYKLWMRAGQPRGRALDEWRRRVRQPANRRVLSLRGLPELVRLEVLYAIQRRAAEQVRAAPDGMSTFVDQVRAAQVTSVLDFDLGQLDEEGNLDNGRFARYVLDRVALAYRDPESELLGDRWDLRVLGRRGHLDFAPIRQDWLREGTKRWAAATLVRVTGSLTMQARVRAVAVLSHVLTTGPGGGEDPGALSRRDVDRFLQRLRSLRSPVTGEALSANSAFTIAKGAGLVVREATEMGFFPGLNPTFFFRRGDARWRVVEEEEARAIPAHVIAQLDAQLDLLRRGQSISGGDRARPMGVLGDQTGEVAVLAYRLLKGTGRRLGEIAGLHLDCLGVDEAGKAVLVYDNHKAARMARRLPLADSELVEAIRAQQRWVTGRFPEAERERLWLLPRPTKNADGSGHISANQLSNWIRAWVDAIPAIDALPTDGRGEAVPFDRVGITPHAFRHTYAQTLADEGVEAPVLRDLMDHRNMATTLGYYRVTEKRKRQAMELVARHTVDNRGTIRPASEPPSRVAGLREQLSWVAVPMGKCSEPTNVRAGGQACPIRYQCAGCPHFESDPSYLPDLRAYADELRREREVLLALGAASWVIDNVAGQLGVIVEHVRRHEQLLAGLDAEQREAIEDASRTVRKARQSVPVAFGRRQRDAGDG